MSQSVKRLCLERGDSVAALLFNVDSRQLTLVNQFKYPTYAKGPGWIKEVIAGMVDPDETPETAMRREILEESGYRVCELEHISTFYVSPGGSSERIFLYYATVRNSDRVEAGGGVESEQEDIQLVEMSLEEAIDSIATGELADAKTILAIYWLQNHPPKEAE